MTARKGSGRRSATNKPARAQSMSELLRNLDDSKAAAILATGATVANVEEALLWAEGASDVLGESGRPLAGASARVYKILTAEESYPEEEP